MPVYMAVVWNFLVPGNAMFPIKSRTFRTTPTSFLWDLAASHVLSCNLCKSCANGATYAAHIQSTKIELFGRTLSTYLGARNQRDPGRFVSYALSHPHGREPLGNTNLVPMVSFHPKLGKPLPFRTGGAPEILIGRLVAASLWRPVHQKGQRRKHQDCPRWRSPPH